jgi:hypothetical protein
LAFHVEAPTLQKAITLIRTYRKPMIAKKSVAVLGNVKGSFQVGGRR